jgi:aryl-alcohol dehydrogenase-like predicted oxidoreductase
MHRPIRVDNSRPATVWDTARTLGVSKKRTEEIIREVRKMLRRDDQAGEVVIRSKRSGNFASRNGAKTHKKNSTRRKAASR